MAKVSTEAATHPFGWVGIGTKCGKECGQDAYLHPKVRNAHGHCRTCYSQCWENDICMAPGCNNIARKVVVNGKEGYGIYCDDCLTMLFDGNTPRWCAIVGCIETATHIVNGYPACTMHDGARLPFTKWAPRDKREYRDNGNGGSRPTATTKPAITSITEEEWNKVKPLGLRRLAAALGGASRDALLARSEIHVRVIDALTNLDPVDLRLDMLDDLLPPRTQPTTPSQPSSGRKGTVKGTKPVTATTAAPADAEHK